MNNQTNQYSLFFVYTQSFAHVEQVDWEFKDKHLLSYRTPRGLKPLCEIVSKNDNFYVLTDDERLLLQEMVLLKDEERIHLIHVQNVLESQIFAIKDDISIGRDKNCDIQIQSPYISMHHVKIKRTTKGIQLEDAGSRNGIYINDIRVERQNIGLKDIIHLPYLYLLVHPQFMVASYVKDYVQVSLKPFESQNQLFKQRDFNRVQKEPVLVDDLPSLNFSIKSPVSKEPSPKPLWMVVMPAMAMGLSSSMMMVSAFQNDSMLSKITGIAMGGGMLFSSVLLPLLIHRHDRKIALKDKTENEEAYHRYYANIEKTIEQMEQDYLSLYEQRYVNTLEAIVRVASLKKIWQKDENSQDALQIVLGDCVQSLPWKIEGGELPIQLHYTALQKRYHDLLTMNQNKKMSFIFDLLHERLLGIYGVEGLGYALQLLLQLCVTHDYRSLHVWICAPETQLVQWGVSYLPHLLKENGMRRLLVTKEDFIQFQHDLRVKNDNCLELLFLVHSSFSNSLSIDELIAQYPQLSIIEVAETHQELSSVCTHIVHAGKNQKATYFYHHSMPIEYPSIGMDKIRKVNEQLSFIRWHSDQFKQKSFGFLALFEVSKIEELQIMKRWQRKKKMDKILIPLGYDEYQEKIILNVHEKGQGPHGIIAGMTGSGKSELLITFILSLCVQYSAHEVSFLLIDYKGGMSASVFKDLPHISYIMSNLNDQSIRRVSLSLEAELKRRQLLFQECAIKQQLSMVDMDKYWELVETGICQPLPHLFVIADEFAELKSSHAEFLGLLKKISRIGRSLGIHLILATQKPSGIIDDEILSNSRFRICLKVAYTQDSNDVLKHEDAAFLKEAGSFLLQVGNDEMYIQGRSSYTQMPYYESNAAMQKKISFHHANGKPYLSKQMIPSTSAQTQLKALVAHMSNLADQLHPITFHLCEAELTLKQQNFFHNKSQIYLGELDDVQNQCIHPFYLAESGNHLIFGKKGSGKELFIRTIIYEYARLNAGVSIFILTTQKQRLNDLSVYRGVSDIIDVYHQESYQSFLYQLQHRSFQKRVIIVLDLYERLMECVSTFVEDFMVMRNVASQLIVTGFSALTLPYRWLPYFEHRHLLQMEDKSEYQSIHNGEGVVPQNIQGSGITLFENRPILFQLYPYEKELIQQLNKDDNNEKIPVLPSSIPMLFKQGYLYLGKHLDSKEDFFIDASASIMICSQYEIPQVFYRYVEAYEAKYHQKLDISFYSFQQWKIYQYDEVFQQNVRNASFIFAGSGLLECLYALPLPAHLHKEITNQQLVCYTSQKVNYVAMMEELE